MGLLKSRVFRKWFETLLGDNAFNIGCFGRLVLSILDIIFIDFHHVFDRSTIPTRSS
jgi:hypothetical protein